MNKKFLFAAMSLAALTACSTDDFESQQQVAEGVSPIQFEVINNDAMTRASMNGNKITWSAADGDLFTLYHGGTASGTPIVFSSYENATYKATAVDGQPAKLTTPSMIKPGSAIMVWPVDTTFSATGNLSIKIDKDQTKDIENHIPYVSDLINIAAYGPTGYYNEAGYNRTYPVYMRPMASQLNLVADYAGTDATLNTLATGADPIEKIKLTSVELRTDATVTPTTKFTTQIPLNFTPKTTTGTNNDQDRWNAEVPNNNWSHVTGFGTPDALTSSDYLSTKCITGIESAKFLMLPQANIATATAGETTPGVVGGAVVVNTNYGKVVIAAPGVGGSKYTTTPDEIGDAWYRYQAPSAAKETYETETTIAKGGTGTDANYVRYTTNVMQGMMQVIDVFSNHKHSAGVVKTEPTGAAATRYVKVLLTHLDMEGLHIKNDAQLYNAIRVWKEMRLATANVYLDGDDNGEFEISQKTIKKINEVNAAAAAEATPRAFTAKPCKVASEICRKIVITGGGNIENMAFLRDNETFTAPEVGTAEVVLKAGENWKWAASSTAAKTLTIAPVGGTAGTNTGISKIINKGTLTSNATATLAIYNNASTPAQIFTVPFENAKGATWDITAGVVNVQFSVTNLGTVDIASGAQYRQDGNAESTNKPTFTNQALTLPKDYLADPTTEQIGVVNNKGVFATVSTGEINNYGLIEHADKDAMTFITNNATGTGFAAAFNDAATSGGTDNKMGRINLPWGNKEEEYISISNAIATNNPGFVSVTINGEVTNKKLNNAAVGALVNYVIVKNGITTIEAMPASIKYVEINEPSTRIEWKGSTTTYSYTGLMVLSELSIQRNTTVNVTGSTYLEADLYNGGAFTSASYTGYYGGTDTSATRIITW